MELKALEQQRTHYLRLPECSRQSPWQYILLARLESHLPHIPPILETPIHLGSKWDVMEETLRQEGDNAIQYANDIAEEKGIDYEGVVIEGNQLIQF